MYCCEGEPVLTRKSGRAYIMFVNDHAVFFAKTVKALWPDWQPVVSESPNGSSVRFLQTDIPRLTELLTGCEPEEQASHKPAAPWLKHDRTES